MTPLQVPDEKRVLDVLPDVWPRVRAFFVTAGDDPASVIEGSLKLQLGDAGTATDDPTPSDATRGGRARADMVRIRGKSVGNALVTEMVSAAFKAMIPATDNHASDFLPGPQP